MGVTDQELVGKFEWNLPSDFNMASACADRHDGEQLALIEVTDRHGIRHFTFGDLADWSSRFANALRGLEVGPGDRVAVVLSQRVETGISHLAVWKLGAISVPMSCLFGPDALRHRLHDSGAKVVVTDANTVERVASVASELGDITVILADEDSASRHPSLWDLVRTSPHEIAVATTKPETPALLIYTSGTTGAPKGALHGHGVLLGHLPGFESMYDSFPVVGDRLWTPADWAWIGGLFDAVIPAWFHGVPVIAAGRSGAFDPTWAMDLMVTHGVTTAFVPPSALKILRRGGVSHPEGLRAVMSGGEPLGKEMLEWGRTNLGVTINEIYGQTEANLVVGNSSSVWDVRPGSMGRPYPGHDVAVIGDDGRRASPGVTGEIAVHTPDPVMFLGYWENEVATAGKFIEDPEGGSWLRTGDLGTVDEDGYLWFVSRNDDVINSSGYRIGPGEIEDCLLGHPAVVMAAVVGVPDPDRGEAVKAFIKLAPTHEPSEELKVSIRDFVRANLAAYEYPRQIEFVDELPMTTTGKVLRRELRNRG